MNTLENHTIYSVYCDWDADEVYIDHLPTEDELKQIVSYKDWFAYARNEDWKFKKTHLDVEKLEILTLN